MKIAIIGMGNVGFTVGKKWVQAKHEVTFGSRPESIQKHRKKLLSENLQAKAESVRTAASDADVIVLAVPHTESLNVADSLRDIKGKTIIDVSNWFKPDFSSLALGFSTSGAEEIQKRLPNSHVVKAFNHYGADVMENPQFGDRKAVLYFCGSNPEALNKVAELVKDVGFEGVGVDNIEFARTLEPLALVWMAGLDRFGTEHAFGLLKR
jgi:8-hydroxy-5-deazaflavin:NADPH oxidoreductase